MKLTSVPYTPDPALSLDNPRWERPEMLIPGRKPTGPVKIDWSHPLAQRVGFVALDDTEIIRYKRATIGSGATVGFHPKYGKFYDNDNVDITLDWSYGTGACPISTSNGAGTGDFTLLVIAAPEASTSGGALISQAVNSSAQTYILYNTASGFANNPGYISFYTWQAAETSCGADDLADGNWHVIIGRRSGTTLELFVDGVSRASNTGTVRNIYTVATGIALGGIHDYTNWDAEYPISTGMGWNRALTNAEIESISDNPYQFLIPA